jgi:hypothetical protein
MKKIGASLYFAMIIVLLIGIFAVAPNFKELWADGTFWIYVAVLVLVAGASIYTTNQKT